MRAMCGVIALAIAVSVAIPGRAEEAPTIKDKTLAAWVFLADLKQQGGSALTLDDQASHFDGIVFGEIAPGRWMAGSDQWNRTMKDQSACAEETADPKTCVKMAIVYKGNQISVYRDDKLYAEHSVGASQTFGPGSVVVMGLRHIEATTGTCLAGAIEEARLYNSALTVEQIAGLKQDQPSEPKPLAWWTFDDGRASDAMGVFPDAVLVGNARVADGKLMLDGSSYVVCTPKGQAERWMKMTKKSEGNELIAAVRQHRANLLADPNRPAYHFVSPEGTGMPFDPNGALYWNGRYHLCYIFQDERGHCWGHVSSTDLLHWRFHPPALFPSPGDPDHGIFSGNAFVNLKGEATLLYHGVDAGNCIATSSEKNLDHWTKLASNPIVPNPKEGEPGFGKYASWDPHGWVEGDTYYAIFGGNPGSGIPATLFRSKNMEDWEYLHPILENDMPGVAKDDDISCPDFFKIGNKQMLLCISHKRGCRYYLGRWENERFFPESHAWMNWPGGTCFAPESLVDDKGRRIMWAWVLDRIPVGMMNPSSWSGVMTLPRVLSLADDGTLRIEPANELETLRTAPRHFDQLVVKADSEMPLKDVQGDCLELAFEIQPGNATRCGVKVRCSPDGQEQTAIGYDAANKKLVIDFSRSTLDTSITYGSFTIGIGGGDNPLVTAQEAPFELKDGEPLRLRVFVDRSIVEAFANDRQCVTQRIYPTRADSLGVSLFAQGGECTVENGDVWEMAATNAW